MNLMSGSLRRLFKWGRSLAKGQIYRTVGIDDVLEFLNSVSQYAIRLARIAPDSGRCFSYTINEFS
jgi:hypothetical protein